MSGVFLLDLRRTQPNSARSGVRTTVGIEAGNPPFRGEAGA